MPTCAGHHGVLIHMRATVPWPQGEQLKFLLLPKDPLDEKNIMLEVRCSWVGWYRLSVMRLFCVMAALAELVRVKPACWRGTSVWCMARET